jgi:hypothetical protein
MDGIPVSRAQSLGGHLDSFMSHWKPQVTTKTIRTCHGSRGILTSYRTLIPSPKDLGSLPHYSTPSELGNGTRRFTARWDWPIPGLADWPFETHCYFIGHPR